MGNMWPAHDDPCPDLALGYCIHRETYTQAFWQLALGLLYICNYRKRAEGCSEPSVMSSSVINHVLQF